MFHQKMMRRTITVLVIGALTRISAAAIPGADNPKCYTEHTYRQQLLEFNHRTIVDAYQQVGHHDAKWDADANKFLEAITVRLSDAGAESFNMLPNPLAPAEQLEAMGRAVLAEGCDDPLVIDMFCIVLNDEQKLDELRPLIQKNVDVFMQSHYPVFRAAACVRRAIRVTDPNSQQDLLTKLKQMLHDGNLATVTYNKWTGPVDRRIVYSIIAPDLQALPEEQQGQFYQDAKSAGGDEWLTDVIGGTYHINNAWKARGRGVASTVTDQGWKDFAKELTAASDCLQAAYKLQPTYPEAPTDMITVCKGQSDAPGARQWFDRAVQGQLDYDPAYLNYLDTILPRWLGSHEQMLAFAKECAATNRYDTNVPRWMVMTVYDINKDRGNDLQVWQVPGTYEAVRDVLAHYAERKDDADFYDSEIGGLAWYLHRYDDARAAMDKIGGKANSRGMITAGVIYDRATSSIYALTGEFKTAVKQAEDAYAAGKIDDAIAGYDSLKMSVKPEDPGAAWIKGRDQELKWQKQFDAGEEVNLIPTETGLPGWWAKDGDFTSDGQQVTGTLPVGSTSPLCGNRFGLRWHLHMTMKLLSNENASKVPETAMIGPIFCFTPRTQGYGLHLHPDGQTAVWYDPDQAPFTVNHCPIPATPTMDIDLWDGKGQMTMNGHPFMPYRNLWRSTDPDGRIGFVIKSPAPGVKFVISEMKIRKLTAQPNEIKGENG